MVDTDLLELVLSALARGAGGEAGQRAWMALSGMTARTCGRFSAEARAVATARASGESGQTGLSDTAALLVQRARSDPGFGSGLAPWLAAARMLLADGGTVDRVSRNRD